MCWKHSETDGKITSIESLLQIYLTTQQVMLVLISILTLGASRLFHAQALLLPPVIIFRTPNIPLPRFWLSRSTPCPTFLLRCPPSLRLLCSRPHVIIRVGNNTQTGLVSLRDGILWHYSTGDFLGTGLCVNLPDSTTRRLRLRGSCGPSPSLSFVAGSTLTSRSCCTSTASLFLSSKTDHTDKILGFMVTLHCNNVNGHNASALSATGARFGATSGTRNLD